MSADTQAFTPVEPAPPGPEKGEAPIDREKLLEHSYDGIQEYDNPLPGWWSFIFWVTILFSPLYAVYYHYGQGPLVEDEYAADVAALSATRAAQSLAAPVSDEALRDLAKDAQSMQAIAETFKQKCAACHGEQGQGQIGPNLTDAYWIHGGTPTAIYRTIEQGVPAKGMIAWGPLLKPEELRLLTAYVTTLQGTNPPNPKAPEGEPVAAAPPGDGSQG